MQRPTSSGIELAREQLHENLATSVLGVRSRRTIRGLDLPVLSNADGHNDVSVYLAAGIADLLPNPVGSRSGGTAAGSAFETAVLAFITEALRALGHLLEWPMFVGTGKVISEFVQYEHLDELERAIKANPELEAAIGGDYLVRPDIVVWREALDETALARDGEAIATEVSTRSPVRRSNFQSSKKILHASVSCKWTIRSDRVQNTRTEGLNLARNRKGRAPHVVAVTMEPLPSRLASIAVGTGDIDCVYHAALDELVRAADLGAESIGGTWMSARDRLRMMIASSRLRDISDLPLDLLV